MTEKIISEFLAKNMWCRLYDVLFYNTDFRDEMREIRYMTAEERDLIKRFSSGDFPELGYIKSHMEEWTPAEILRRIKDEVEKEE